MRIGDSLRAKIDDGLARSRFGVVVLSPKYLEKRWTANELDAFFATEDQTRTRMLPVWHEVSAAEVASRSPLLAGRLAAQTSAGLENVARAIALVVVSSIDSPATTTPGLCQRLLRVLDEDGSARAVVNFLRAHPSIVAEVNGGDARENRTVWDVQGGGHSIDAAIGRYQGTSGRFDWALLRVAAASATPVQPGGARDPEIERAVQALAGFRAWAASHLADARSCIPELDADTLGIVVAGRRSALAGSASKHFQAWNDELVGIHIRTHDWLVEACAKLDAQLRHSR